MLSRKETETINESGWVFVPVSFYAV